MTQFPDLRWPPQPRTIWRTWTLAVAASLLALMRLAPDTPPPAEWRERPPAPFTLPPAPIDSAASLKELARKVTTDAALWGSQPLASEVPPPPPPQWHVAGVYVGHDEKWRTVVVVEDGKSRPSELGLGDPLPDGAVIERIGDYEVCAQTDKKTLACHHVHLSPDDRRRIAAGTKPQQAPQERSKPQRTPQERSKPRPAR